jgi:hypothetical protein
MKTLDLLADLLESDEPAAIPAIPATSGASIDSLADFGLCDSLRLLRLLGQDTPDDPDDRPRCVDCEHHRPEVFRCRNHRAAGLTGADVARAFAELRQHCPGFAPKVPPTVH